MRGKGKEKLLGRCKSKWIFYEKIVTRRKDENKMNGWSYLREKKSAERKQLTEGYWFSVLSLLSIKSVQNNRHRKIK